MAEKNQNNTTDPHRITPEPDEVKPDPKAKKPEEEPKSLPEDDPKPRKKGKKGPMQVGVGFDSTEKGP